MNDEEVKEEFLDLNDDFEKQKKRNNRKEDKMSEKLSVALKEVESWKNEYAKLLADSQNLRKSLEKDQRDFIKYRAVGFIENLLPVLDNFQLAFSITPPSVETQNYLKGFEMIYANLKASLEAEGLMEINPKVGSTFDPQLMEAVEMQEDQEKDDNCVIKVFRTGYKMHERLIRPASVIVNQKAENPNPKE